MKREVKVGKVEVKDRRGMRGVRNSKDDSDEVETRLKF